MGWVLLFVVVAREIEGGMMNGIVNRGRRRKALKGACNARRAERLHSLRVSLSRLGV